MVLDTANLFIQCSLLILTLNLQLIKTTVKNIVEVLSF